jgi:predicted RNA-binding protein associated with RNAse of E/G family
MKEDCTNGENNFMESFEERSTFLKPKMWRKRYIPDEIIDISKDNVVFRDNNLIITKWDVLHPREDFQRGVSYIMLDRGIKISRFLKADGKFVKYYCDIIEVEFHKENDEYIFKDLLVDVEIYADNQVRVLDMDELIEAETQGLITKQQGIYAREKLQELLDMIELKKFPPKELLEY